MVSLLLPTVLCEAAGKEKILLVKFCPLIHKQPQVKEEHSGFLSVLLGKEWKRKEEEEDVELGKSKRRRMIKRGRRRKKRRKQMERKGRRKRERGQ